MGMLRFNFLMTEQQVASLWDYSERTGLTASELLRRMADYTLREPVMNELVPSMSGSLGVGRDVRA